MTCTFFGHRDAPNKTEPILRSTLIDLIENKNVDTFYVGNNGAFDFMVRKNLKLLKSDFPHITYAVVLAYIPGERDGCGDTDYSDTIYPDVLDCTPPKYAITKRNQWMIDSSDYVVTYVKHAIGGAAKFKELAEKKGKTVFELAEFE